MVADAFPEPTLPIRTQLIGRSIEDGDLQLQTAFEPRKEEGRSC